MKLQEWAKQTRIWKKESWQEYVNQIVEILEICKQIESIDEFLNNLKGKEIYEIEEPLRGKVETAIAGGGSFKNSFAKFMFEKFGIHVGEEESFENSLEYYKRYGTISRINKENAWSNEVSYFSKKLKYVLEIFEKKGLEVPKISISINPEDFLPLKGEKPEKLVSLLNEFYQNCAEFVIGVNPYTTFLSFVRLNYADNVLNFLNITYEEFKELYTFLDITMRNPVDFRKVEEYKEEIPILLYSDYTLPTEIVGDIIPFIFKRLVPDLKSTYKNWVFLHKDRLKNIKHRDFWLTIGKYTELTIRNPFKGEFYSFSNKFDFWNEAITLSELGLVRISYYYYTSYGYDEVTIYSYSDILEEFLNEGKN